MKSLIIIVPGAKTKYPSFIKVWLRQFYNYFGISTEKQSHAWMEPLKKYLENETSSKIIIFDWPGGISRISVYRAARKLARLIDQKKDYSEIKFFCKSLGGNVVDLAINKTKNTNNITKVIYVATPHQPSTVALPANLKLINIYSKADNYIDFANRILYLGLGKKHLKGAQNIVFENLKHSDYTKDTEIEYNNQKINFFKLYKQLFQ